MKRLRLWLRELSLSQQLLCIIFLFVTTFVVFVFLFLSPSLDNFTQSEMYNRLHNVRDNIARLENSQPGSMKSLVQVDNDITVLYYEVQNRDLKTLSGEELPLDVEHNIILNMQSNLNGIMDYAFKTRDTNYQEETFLYSATILNNGNRIITAMPDSIRLQLRSSLVSRVITTNILYITILLFLLFLWVTTIIIPLRQIKAYIDRLKNDEETPLELKRYDEIGQVGQALVDMQGAIKKQNREKEEMIQNISHDLKTPIATIKSYSEAIKDGIYPYETLEKSVDVIIEHASRLEKKVKSLIVFNRMGYLMDTALEGKQLHLKPIVERVVLSLMLIRPEIEMKIEQNDSCYVHGDEEPWRIVIENLLENALRYAKTYIRVELNQDGLCVYNDGPHIEFEVMKKIFRPYEKGTDGQFGLGLSIVRKVVDTYGYLVRAENTYDGVCFRIFLEEELPKKQRKSFKKHG